MEETLSLTVRETPKEGIEGITASISISSSSNGLQLKQEIQKVSGGNIPAEIQKLIFGGKIVKDELALKDQGIKNGIKIMITRTAMPEQVKKMQTEMDEATKINRFTKAAEKLASREETEFNGGERRLELVNQHGQKVQLSANDEKFLKMGLTLHEKGKTSLQRGDLKEALELLGEADKSFSKCSPEILSSIDNYSLLCLDLSWCYFRMQDLTFLKDAQWRLKKAQEILERLHGKNYERLRMMKGGVGADIILWSRLYLLHGITAFHNNKYQLSKAFLEQAATILNLMKVSDQDMLALINMGFTDKESRLALRTCKANAGANIYNETQNDDLVLIAANFVLKRREEKAERIAALKKQRKEQRMKEKIGKTASGLWVDLEMLNNLVSLGFDRKLVSNALKQTDNNADMALNLLTQSPELLMVKDEKKPKKVDYTEEIKQIEGMGFPASIALGTLQKTNGNVNRAIEMILAGNGVEAFPETESNPTAMDVEKPQENANPSIPEEPASLKEEIDEEAEEELTKGIHSGMEVDGIEEEEHLDTPLAEEESALTQYMKLLESHV